MARAYAGLVFARALEHGATIEQAEAAAAAALKTRRFAA